MAYLREIRRPECDTGDKKTATQELFDRRNGLYGRYCSGCAGRMLRRLLADEKQEAAAAAEVAAANRIADGTRSAR